MSSSASPSRADRDQPAAAPSPSPARSTMACPADGIFVRLIEGALDDAQVRRLQAHCDGCAACDRTLAELARTIAPDRGEWVGERYRLLEPLGSGGMGVVYAAFDAKLQRKVAIKRLHERSGAPGERRRARFLREARLLASLSHPNVVTVHDVGGIDGEIYVVMELVEGWPMSRWIGETRPRPGWRQIVERYLQAGRGLAAAHRLDVVHRDVKPENILVARSGRGLIGDFGLAGLREVGASSSEPAAPPSGLTETGAVLGTPAYMAPEVHEGGPSDVFSDQFSFCMSLYESLHGRRPFSGASAGELAAAVRRGRLPAGRDGVPRAVDRVLATGLRADPRRRHPSMEHLLADLARAQSRRAPAALFAAGAVVLAVAAALNVTLAHHGQRPPRASAGAAARPAPPGAPPPASAAAVAPPQASVAMNQAAVVAPPSTRAKLVPGPRSKRSAVAARGALAARPHLPASPEEQETDPRLLLLIADGEHGNRDGPACLAALSRIPADAWPSELAPRALRLRAACEMLRGGCEEGRRAIEPLDGPEAAHAALLVNCPPHALPVFEDRLLAIAEQADEARYAGNRPGRRQELEQSLIRQTAAPEMQSCLAAPASARACARRLALLARAYQVVAESFLADRDCAEGAALDVMQSQLRFRSLEPESSEAAVGCRAQRTADVYTSCAGAAAQAELRCVARVQAAARAGGAAVLPELAR